MKNNKTAIRVKKLKTRNMLLAKVRDEKAAKIRRAVFDLDEFKKAKIIGIYWSFKSEVDTIEIIKVALKLGKKVAIPKLINNSMEFAVIRNLTSDLQKNRWGICEPKFTQYINKEMIDLILIPLIAFDQNNHRIGYGKGYYDRYLANYHGSKIGLAFREQLSNEEIMSDNFDIKLDKIIAF